MTPTGTPERADQKKPSDEVTKRFGMREFGKQGKYFTLNGEKIILRGTNSTLHRFFEDPECRALPWNRAWVTKLLLDRAENKSANELLKTYYEEYLDGIPCKGFREGERARGMEEAKRSWAFRRYVLERTDFGIEEFMRLNLSEEDYAIWCELNKPFELSRQKIRQRKNSNRRLRVKFVADSLLVAFGC